MGAVCARKGAIMFRKKAKQQSDPFIVRQGDVLLRRVHKAGLAGMKKIDRDQGRIVLAYGEVTGHAHAIDSPLADLFEERDGVLYLRVSPGDQPVTLAHEEHAPIILQPGTYEVIRQREYDPVRDRYVMD